MGIILSLITGIFFLIGYYLNKLCNKEKVSVISVSLAFIVVLNLILVDIIPEIAVDLIVEQNTKLTVFAILFILIGLCLLKILDLLVPHHHHNHHEHKDDLKEHKEHIEHISKISILALVLHNLLECTGLYILCTQSVLKGLLMTITIGLHNIPLGLQIGSGLKKHKLFYLLLLTLSGLFGGIICFLIGTLPEMVEYYILCFTLGMLLYLLLFELLVELKNNRKNISTIYGIIIGIVLVLIINAISINL